MSKSFTLAVGCWSYRVVAVDRCSSPDDPGAFGYCPPLRRTIELRRDQSFDHAFETLAHKYGHACEAAGIDLNQEDDEKRMTALATVACSFGREYAKAGSDDALASLLGIAPDVPAVTPLVVRDPHSPRIFVGTTKAYTIGVRERVANAEGEAVWGLCDFDAGEVLLDAEIEPERRAKVVHHELFHAFDFQYPGERDFEQRAEFAANVATEINFQIERLGGWSTIDALFDAAARRAS